MRGLLVILVLLCGCADDAVTYPTKGDAAQAFAEALCSRAIECDTIEASQEQECISDPVRIVCGQVDCSAPPAVSDAEINSCLDSINAQPCDSVWDGKVCFDLLGE